MAQRLRKKQSAGKLSGPTCPCDLQVARLFYCTFHHEKHNFDWLEPSSQEVQHTEGQYIEPISQVDLRLIIGERLNLLNFAFLLHILWQNELNSDRFGLLLGWRLDFLSKFVVSDASQVKGRVAWG